VLLLEKYISREDALIPLERVRVNSDGEHYKVESILDHKTMYSKKYYLIKWLGWAPSYNEWLPFDALDCRELLNAYESLIQDRTPYEKRRGRGRKS
jgi:chromodomain-containing protein